MLRRWLSTSAFGAAMILLNVTPASAQYGWGGWGGWGGGQTVEGSIAQGMGVFAAGAGQYNLDTAQANSINANTMMNWNEYWYQSQQAVNRKYYAKMAQRKQDNVTNREAIYNRLRDNPNKFDIYRGDALNVVFDQLSSPKVYLRGLSSASIKFPGEQIRDIPFQYAQAAITSTVHQILTKGSAPAILKTDAFKPENERLREIAAKIRGEDESDGKIDPETLEEAQALLTTLQAKVKVNLKAGSDERVQADRFLKAALGLTSMLGTPAINVLLSDVDKHPEATVGDLLGFMKAFNLRFGVADTPREKMVYDELYPLLVKLRDEAFPKSKPGLGDDVDANPDHPADFFASLKEKDPSAPPAPGPAPARDPK